MTKEFDPRRLDVKRFAQDAQALASEGPLGAFPRLREETGGRGADLPVRWSARGEMRNPGHVNPQLWLFLQGSATLPLVCQRCLQPVDVEVTVDRTFRFVADEATAAAEDDESEEDVLAASRDFDLLELLEDEILMELPLAPRHAQCPVALPTTAGQEEFEAALQADKVNPFEALGRLKNPRD